MAGLLPIAFKGNGMKRLVPLLALFLAAPVLAQKSGAPAARNPKWAQPIKAEGLPNLHKISDALYRGAQPTAEGIKELKKMGVKTIVCLRSVHSDKDLLVDSGLNYEEISFKTWHAENEDVVRFLKIVTDKSKQPVFFHCQHGADRTGTMCAIYRIVVESWTKKDAINEMTDGGYSFHTVWTNLIKYISPHYS